MAKRNLNDWLKLGIILSGTAVVVSWLALNKHKTGPFGQGG